MSDVFYPVPAQEQVCVSGADPAEPHELRALAWEAYTCPDALQKAKRVRDLASEFLRQPPAVDTQRVFECTPARPDQPVLVHPARVPTRGVGSEKGRGMLLHALAHIEFNAISLALDALLRFTDQPEDFYRDWWKVASEEAYHFLLLVDRMAAYGVRYGDYEAHDGLWQMAEKTRDDVLARMALVPRLLEARGLDVSPAIRDKLHAVGDVDSAAVLEVILQDEIGHVDIGNRWYRYFCHARGLDPLTAYADISARYSAPLPRPPFNHPARLKAGFTQAELDWMTGCIPDAGAVSTNPPA